MSADVRILGLEDLERRLKALPPRMAVNTLRRAVRRGALPIAERARSLAPVRTGKLRDSIRVSTRFSRRQLEVIGRITAGRARRKGDPFYAAMVEFGTAPHVIKPRNRRSLFIAGLFREVVNHPGSRARPFMRPALDAEFGNAVDAIAAEIKRSLQGDLR